MSPPFPRIAGYEFVRELGVGGMATVYLALQTSLDRRVAIKVMRRAEADDNAEKRFLVEGRTMAKLPHRNVVGVYDIVQSDAVNYIAMEYLGGGTLSGRMRDGLSLAEAVSVVVQVAGALQYAHDSGVVHRDLKPANILFRDPHTPVLTDFGIARQRDATSTRLTQTGMMIGTPTYMSPEQAMGGDVDGRSDQYSLGVMFYEMLTGSAPFGGETPLAVVLAHLNHPPPPLPPQFVHFQPALDRMLAKEREQRYADLLVFVRELKSLLIGSDTLLARLQIDPNQSASEQLRLLGFSESQINTGSGAAAERRQAPRDAGVRSDASRTSGPGVRMDPLPPPRVRRPAWLLPTAIAAAALVLIALGWWAAFGGSDALDPAMRRLANNTLEKIDRLIADDRLLAPPGDNAFEELQALQAATGAMPDIEQRLQRIVDSLQAQAEHALAKADFASAETRIGEALAVQPDAAALRALQQRIETAKLAAERGQRVGALLAQAEAARKVGRMSGDGSDNALAFARQALEVDPQSVAARAAFDAIVADMLAPARTALAKERLDEARRLLQANALLLGGEQAWRTLDADVASASTREQQRTRIAELVALARQQIATGRHAEPAGDNALETLARVGELAAGNAEAATLRANIATALVRDAEQAASRGDGVGALARHDQALLAQPANAAIAAARDAIAQQLDRRQAEVARHLGDARAAINDRRYLAPAGTSARDALLAVLALDPQNADAAALLASLPTLVRDAAAALATEARHADALDLLAEATAIYPDDAALAAATRDIAAARDRAQRASLRQTRLAELQALLARRQLNADTARAIGFVLAELHKLDPADADVLAYRERFVRGIARVIDGSDTPERLDAMPPVLAQVREQLGGDSADVVALQATFDAARERLAAAERARIAASSGTLVLNATPWANVESVVDEASGKALVLPDDRATPLRIGAPAGTYRIRFRHPDLAQPVVVVASVDARGTRHASAAFRSVTAADYLRRAGYAQ